MASLTYRGRSPNADFSVVNKLYVDSVYAANQADLIYVNQTVAHEAVNNSLVTTIYVDTRDGFLAQETTVDVADNNYLLTSELGKPNGLAQLGTDTYVPLSALPNLKTQRKAFFKNSDMLALTGTATRELNIPNPRDFEAGRLTIPDLGFPYIPLLFATVTGGSVAGTNINGTAAMGTGNFAQLSITRSDNILYSYTETSSQKHYETFIVLPDADPANSSAPISGENTFSLWAGLSPNKASTTYTLSAVGLSSTPFVFQGYRTAMAELFYVGLRPSDGNDVEALTYAKNQAVNSGTTRSYVQGRVKDTIAGRATGDPNSSFVNQNYVDQQDAPFVTADYYKAQDLLLTPNNAKGTPNGVASLVNGKVPDAQVPVLGGGIIKGPFPVTNVFTGDTFDVPLKIAEWKIGPGGFACQPWAFMSASILSDGGLPVIEIKAGDPTQTTYASQILVAQGSGRSMYFDYQTVEVLPNDPDLKEGQDYRAADDFGLDFYPTTFDMNLTAWLYDDAQDGVHRKVTMTTGLILSASAYLVRMKL